VNGEILGEPDITTAILDRFIHRVEVIQFNDPSYRMKHHSSIFGEKVFKINEQKVFIFT